MIKFEESKMQIIDNIKATMAMENQDLSVNDISMLNKVADNQISIEDAISSIKQNFI